MPGGKFSSMLASIPLYLRSSLVGDLVAGLVIAALSIPISMGYAELAGMPAIYGLYASIIAPVAFAIFSNTSKTVFGMDSATVAMTASMLSLMGIATVDASIAVMPILTLLIAAVLGLFSLLKLGNLIKMTPMPVIHGFIFGIAIVVIFGQLPHLMGLSVHLPESIVEAVPVLVSEIPQASVACIAISVLSIASLFILKRFAPKIPAAIVVLLGASAVAGVVAQVFPDSMIVFLPQVSGSLPQIADVGGSAAEFLLSPSVVNLIPAAVAIAVIIALESLLCLETFSSSEEHMFSPNREMASLGGANAIVGLFGCPPCSASMSRTAAGISAGAQTKLAGIVSAIIIAVVVCSRGRSWACSRDASYRPS